MYELITAFVKASLSNGRWEETDVSAITMRSLYTDYAKVILVVSHPTLTNPVALNLESIRVAAARFDLTPNAYFATLGNKSLPTTPDLPVISPKLVRYADIWRAGYNVRPVSHDAHPDAELPLAEKRDLLITRDDQPYDEFFEHGLVSVNGFIHRTENSVHGIYVNEGAASGRLANDTQLGLLSFKEVGEIQIVPMKASNIYKGHPDTKYSQSAYVNLKKDTETRFVIMVLGGYLHVLDNCYTVVGNGIVRIDFSKIPLAQRYFQSKDQIDLSSLNLIEPTQDPGVVVREMLFSDETIVKYMGLSQSFFVIVNTPELFCIKEQLGRSGIPGVYYGHSTANLPVQIGLGRLGNYWSRNDDGVWVLSVSDNQVNNYQFEHTHWHENRLISDHRDTQRPFDYARGYQLQIGRDW